MLSFKRFIQSLLEAGGEVPRSFMQRIASKGRHNGNFIPNAKEYLKATKDGEVSTERRNKRKATAKDIWTNAPDTDDDPDDATHRKSKQIAGRYGED